MAIVSLAVSLLIMSQNVLYSIWEMSLWLKMMVPALQGSVAGRELTFSGMLCIFYLGATTHG